MNRRSSLLVLSLTVLISGCVVESSEDDGDLLSEVEDSVGAAAILSPQQVAHYAYAAGMPCGPGNITLRRAVAIAFGESGFNTHAYNANTNGSIDYGL